MAHTYTSIHIHIVFSTRKRFPFINQALRSPLHAYMAGIIKNVHAVPIAIDGVGDHVHAVVAIPPSLSVSDLVGKMKSNSSRWMRQSGRCPKFEWQEGYSAFSVSRSALDRVTAYVRSQEAHHHRMTFSEELERLFERHGIVVR